MKTCTKCGTVKEDSAFSKASRSKDGMQDWCKNCMQLWRESAKGRESHRLGSVKYRQTDKGIASKIKYRSGNTEKEIARNKVTYAVRLGKLIKVPCDCGDKEVQAHHEDYSKPLEVEWLCRTCHNERKLVPCKS